MLAVRPSFLFLILIIYESGYLFLDQLPFSSILIVGLLYNFIFFSQCDITKTNLLQFITSQSYLIGAVQNLQDEASWRLGYNYFYCIFWNILFLIFLYVYLKICILICFLFITNNLQVLNILKCAKSAKYTLRNNLKSNSSLRGYFGC